MYDKTEDLDEEVLELDEDEDDEDEDTKSDNQSLES